MSGRKLLLCVAVLLLSAMSARAQVSTTYLKAYYKLDEAADANGVDSHGSHTLTKAGSGGTGPGTGTGKINSARDWEDAASDEQILYSAHHADFSPGDTLFGASLWFKAESLSGGVQYLFVKGEYNTSTVEYQCYIYAGVLYWVVNGDGHDGSQSISLGAISTGTWYHVLVWHDPTANKIYGRLNNGTVVEAAHSTGAYASATEDFCIGALRFGAAIQNGTAWDGLIDEFAWFKGGFPDSTEQTALYNSGNGLALADWTPSAYRPQVIISRVEPLRGPRGPSLLDPRSWIRTENFVLGLAP